ncbi:1-aminocyclopropane-1-carboxylate deaminase/D-cysteine desulfhydrase [Bacterioplanoides sp.]|uniref:1-aminocyclopropane-1-carboxylate deaminase/D-cysteine desulfhydrase n=1 Tax=Bacterioplanoides sp. TaxID=2066072 RepID=UPI003B5C7DBE
MTHSLFDHYPQLAETIPVIEFADLPTPVESFAGTGSEVPLPENLWIKRDDLTNSDYGGNKVRKLEFIIADAQKQKKHSIVTMGATGTNHGVATATFCQANQLDSKVYLFEQPVTDTVLKNLKAMVRHGAKLQYRGSILKTALAYYASHILSPRSYHLPAGGSNIMGCIGFVNAALELKQQIDNGELPEPDKIICPVGSSGTLAGLTLGCQLLGLKTEVTGIRVAPSHLGPIPICTAETAQKLMQQTYRFLRKADNHIPTLTLNKVNLSDDYYGDGYGVASDAGDVAKTAFKASGIELESTYTAKAAAAALECCRANPQQNILYWHTFNSVDQDNSAVDCQQQQLPQSLKQLIGR